MRIDRINITTINIRITFQEDEICPRNTGIDFGTRSQWRPQEELRQIAPKQNSRFPHGAKNKSNHRKPLCRIFQGSLILVSKTVLREEAQAARLPSPGR